MRSIIIRIGEDISDLTAIVRVARVIEMGRISRDGESYCFVTDFADDVMVFADKYKADVFRVERAKKVEEM